MLTVDLLVQLSDRSLQFFRARRHRLSSRPSLLSAPPAQWRRQGGEGAGGPSPPWPSTNWKTILPL